MDLKTAKNVFSNLMVKAQEKPLTALQKRTLLRARQTIRKYAKPAMNAKRGRYNPSRLQTFQPIRYKGYWIMFNAIENQYWIEKDGAFIGYAKTIPDAEKTIDMLANPKRLEVPRRKHGTMSGSKYSRFFATKAKARAHLKKLNEKGVYGVISRIPDRYGLFELSIRKPNPRTGEQIYYDKGYSDASFGIKPRSRNKDYVRGYKDAKNDKKKYAAPNPEGGIKIYGRCLRIEAVKMVNHTYGGKPTKAGQHYFHDFTTKNAIIYGMPDGSLRIVAK